MSVLNFFLLGQKGYRVAQAASRPDFISLIDFIVIGTDKNVANDYSIAIQELCLEKDIKFIFQKDFILDNYNLEKTIAIAAGWRWLINANYNKIIVFHDSLLPKYRGFNPLVTALLKKEEYVGVSAIVANKDFDKGDILSTKKLRIPYPITIANVINAISDLYEDIAIEIIDKISKGIELEATPQNEREASYSIWRDEEDYRINWNWSAEYISHFVRCVGYPYKGASTTIDKSLVRIIAAEPVEDVQLENRDIGKVLFIKEGKPIVVCGSGLLQLQQVIREDGYSILPLEKFRVRFK